MYKTIKSVVTVALLGAFMMINLQFSTTPEMDSELVPRSSYSAMVSVVMDVYAGPLEDARDECISQCNEDYVGGHWLDAIQRVACRAGCDAAYITAKSIKAFNS